MEGAERPAQSLKSSSVSCGPNLGAADAASSFQIAPPAIGLAKGGGAIRGIGEKFSASPVTGTASMSVPILRAGFGPQLALSYDSGAGNGLFGLGRISLPSIKRKTDKGLPRYLQKPAQRGMAKPSRGHRQSNGKNLFRRISLVRRNHVGDMSSTPRIFIASSSEQIQVAKDIATILLQETPEWQVKPWDEVFDFSKAYVESLERELNCADFAVVVLTGDDWAKIRGKSAILPRDNVIFELGLFIGRLGRDRCFFFVEGGPRTRLASDLEGVKPVTYYPEGDFPNPREPNLKTQVGQVKAQILGFRERSIRYKPTPDDLRGQEALWRFSSRVTGNFWERMRDGDDDLSALSYITTSVNPVTNTPSVSGKAYTREAISTYNWRSITTGVVYGVRPQINYRWDSEDSVGGITGGIGFITFDDDKGLSGEGSFFDTAHMNDAVPTRGRRFRVYRCSVDDVNKMEQESPTETEVLIKEKLESLRWPKQ